MTLTVEQLLAARPSVASMRVIELVHREPQRKVFIAEKLDIGARHLDTVVTRLVRQGLMHAQCQVVLPGVGVRTVFAAGPAPDGWKVRRRAAMPHEHHPSDELLREKLMANASRKTAAMPASPVVRITRMGGRPKRYPRELPTPGAEVAAIATWLDILKTA